MKSFLFSLTLLSVISLSGQSKFSTISIEVDGLCGMCEMRIENAAYIQGVKKADWSQDTHMLDLIYNGSKVGQSEIIAAINQVGHDVKDHPASDKQYANVHGCCRFRDPEQRAKHGLGEPLCTPIETSIKDSSDKSKQEL
tara:strand:- start:962 stop:1381 length:420 start_codon:yes stop_codon:yes gene_type:complete